MFGLPDRKQEHLASLIDLVPGQPPQPDHNEFQLVADRFTACP